MNLRGGGMLVALGTDVSVKDRLAKITDAEGDVLIDTGPMRIVGVEELASLDERVLALLEQLPVATREALRGRVVEELSYEQIAAELCCSQAVVRQHVSRGLRRLRSQLEER